MTIRAVSQGDRYTRACTDSVGFKSTAVPESGIVIDLGDREIFVGWSEIEHLRQGLKSRSAARRVAVQGKRR